VNSIACQQFTCPWCGSHCWGDGGDSYGYCHSSDDRAVAARIFANGGQWCRFRWPRTLDALYMVPTGRTIPKTLNGRLNLRPPYSFGTGILRKRGLIR